MTHVFCCVFAIIPNCAVIVFVGWEKNRLVCFCWCLFCWCFWFIARQQENMNEETVRVDKSTTLRNIFVYFKTIYPIILMSHHHIKDNNIFSVKIFVIVYAPLSNYLCINRWCKKIIIKINFTFNRGEIINPTTTMINCAFFIACVLSANTPFWVKKDPHRCSKVKQIRSRADLD